MVLYFGYLERVSFTFMILVLGELELFLIIGKFLVEYILLLGIIFVFLVLKNIIKKKLGLSFIFCNDD